MLIVASMLISSAAAIALPHTSLATGASWADSDNGRSLMHLQTRNGDERSARYGRANPVSRDTKSKSCSGFRTDSEQDSHTPSQQISDVVGCQNATSPCPVTPDEHSTVRVSSYYTADAYTANDDVEIVGISAEATFGEGYTDSITTTVGGVTFHVPVGQNGYETADARATLFKGAFTGCDDDEEIAGQALVPHKDGVAYRLTITGDPPSELSNSTCRKSTSLNLIALAITLAVASTLMT
ncbi:unnamed protein product [Jaminaea pallidilutea]